MEIDVFDFSRITEEITGWITGASGASDVLNGDLLSSISAAGVDLEMLQGLPVDEIMTQLSASGIDLSGLGDAQLADLLQSLTGDSPGG